MVNKNKYNQSGLTMVELLATIAIVVFVAVSVAILGDKTLSETRFFSMYTQAIFLGKEGVEILGEKEIRNKIRNDIEEDTQWDGVGFWNIDYNGNIDQRTNITNCHKKLRINNSGFYAIGATEDSETLFSCCIIVTAEDYLSELKIKIETSFNYKNEEYTTNIYRIFYD